ncbi:hypothetical protein ACQ4WY_25695 [Janthinobacterium sp. LB2P49]|uniref:hypothetical protein n=1 Tax=Janthinobacterium sp. LB2P49 TaxID=3424198 RepID=UPI003F240B63
MASIPTSYLSMSEAELYQELGDALAGGHAAPTDTEEVERRGYEYFQGALPQIRAIVCGSQIIESFIKKDDVFAVAGTIAEILSGHFQLPRATATLAMLTARMGLRALCPAVNA